MSNYIDIRVFPTSGRTTDDSNNDIDWGTSLITEYNLASIVNTIIDPDINGFVITTNPESGKSFKFNIKGYYFEIDDIDNIINSQAEFVKFSDDSGDITATIKIGSSSNGQESYQYLVSTSNPNWEDVQNSYSLHILNYSGDSSDYSYTIPQDSLIKFKTNSNYRSISIDDGDLDQ